VACRIFRIVGDGLEAVDQEFEQSVVGSEFLPVKSAISRDDWVKAFRGRWLSHRRQLEEFLRTQESSLKKSLQARADVTKKRENDSAKESYRYRLKELQDRSSDRERAKLAKAILKVEAEIERYALFPEVVEEIQASEKELDEQMEVIRQDVERTRELLTREQKQRLEVVLPKRFHVREVRVLPLALTYLIPATKEDLR
jgi:hypothetical protein